MSDNNEHQLVIAAFGKSPELKLDMSRIREAETRYVEAQRVNPSTYAELEHTFNESYRYLKDHVSKIGYQLTLAEKSLREAQADVILGSYAEYLQGKPKSADTTHLKDAFLMRDPAYNAALDRVNQFKALESNFAGKVKVIENVCKYMRQKMYLLSTSGVPAPTIGVTIGRK